MILSSSVVIPLKSRPPTRSRVSFTVAASNNNFNSTNRVDTEQLRTQLEQLHAEAEVTRSKVNSARLRLMRLSETAEKLQRRAANNVLVGKESEARELLLQKKKLMQALEKSKIRSEVLDELSTKINEAISLKETQLIGNVAVHSAISTEDTDQSIRFISPKDDGYEDSNESTNFVPDGIHSGKNEEVESQKCETDKHVEYQQSVIEEATSIDTSNDDDSLSSLKGISSYEGFLELVDAQLRDIEEDVAMILRFSTLIMEDEQKQRSVRLQQTKEILKDVRRIRGRIANMLPAEADES